MCTQMCAADKPWLVRELLDLPFLPTPQNVIEAAVDLVKLKPFEFFADLGCGEGNVLIRAAQKSEAFCVGFEIDQRLIPEAKRNIKGEGVSERIDVVYADLFTTDLSRFDVIYVYPFPTIAAQLAEKMLRECKKGARVVVCDYSLPNLTTAESADVSGSGVRKHRIYVYRF